MVEAGITPYSDLSALVVDDQEFVRRTVRFHLEKLGFGRTMEAGNGDQALEECEWMLPDIVICDIMMQPGDGLEFLFRLRTGPMSHLNQIPVIFLTSNDDEEMRITARELGVDAFMLKPPTRDGLRENIDLVLAGYSLSDS